MGHLETMHMTVWVLITTECSISFNRGLENKTSQMRKDDAHNLIYNFTNKSLWRSNTAHPPIPQVL